MCETRAHRFDVFLSHNSRDKPTVERLADKLREAGLEPWLDRWYLTGGGIWQEDLAAALRASATCAVFVGPHGFGDWAREELLVAQDRAAKGRAFRLIPVLLPGLPDPFDPSSVLPPFLLNRTWVDLRAGIEDPVGFQRLVSAVTGVPLGPLGPAEPQDQTPPYRGLRPFEEEHAEFFFGRDADVQRLLEKLKSSRFLAVLGPSGSGKSSLVRAGLVTALRGGELPDSSTWPIHLLTPGARPLEALAVYLAELGGSGDPLGAAGQLLKHLQEDQQALHLASRLAAQRLPDVARLVLVVDQFEEVFTLCHDEAERTQFLENLLYAGTVPDGRCVIILTLRADFYPRCATYPKLASQVAAQQYLVSPMSLESLRQVIEQPAHRVGLEFEVGLVDAILEDVAGQPGGLPLLEHMLWELWQRRRGRMLTLEGYHDTGGVAGALAKRADEIYGRLSPEEQTIARRVLLRLTQPGEGTEDTRRRASLEELVSQADERITTEGVIRVLADARLLTTSGDERSGERMVDVAHEALIRGWPRLRSWVDENREWLWIRQRLEDAAREWQLQGDDGLLYRGARLRTAEHLAETNPEELSEGERLFLARSRKQDRREQRSRYLGQAMGGAVGSGFGYGLAFALVHLVLPSPTCLFQLPQVPCLSRSGLIASVILPLLPLGGLVGLWIGLAMWWYRFQPRRLLMAASTGAAFLSALSYVGLLLTFDTLFLHSFWATVGTLAAAILGVGLAIGVTLTRSPTRRLVLTTSIAACAVTAAGDWLTPLPLFSNTGLSPNTELSLLAIRPIAGAALGALTCLGFRLTAVSPGDAAVRKSVSPAPRREYA